jgi:hypothetical protein
MTALLILAILTTSYIHNGIIRCGIKPHCKQLYLSKSDKAFYEKLLQSKDEALKAKDDVFKAKDDALKAKDETIKAKDDAFKAKDDALMSSAAFYDKMLKSEMDKLSSANAEILHLQGRLSLRSVFEQFEQRGENYLEASNTAVTKGTTKREKLWNAIIDVNYSDIMQHLGDASTDWPSVAKSLYKLISEEIHNFKSRKVVINDTSMSAEMKKLAEAICKAFPIKYEIITPSQLDLQDESK